MKGIKGILVVLCLFVFTLFQTGCGSAEPIKSYIYPVTKYQLEKAVAKVLHSSRHITIESTEPQDSVMANPTNSKDTSTTIKNQSDSHRTDSTSTAANGKAAMQIKIKVGDIVNDYVFRYRGNEQDWKRSSSSVIFIQYAGDQDGHSLSQGQNENGAFRSQMAKDFTSLFEHEVISKVDSELNVKHTERLGPLNDLH